jgi:hypothetical protein
VWFTAAVYHRTIGSIVATLRRHGFRLELLDEPLPAPDQVATTLTSRSTGTAHRSSWFPRVSRLQVTSERANR